MIRCNVKIEDWERYDKAMCTDVEMGVNYGVYWCEYGVTPTPSGGTLQPQTLKPSTEYLHPTAESEIGIQKANNETSTAIN